MEDAYADTDTIFEIIISLYFYEKEVNKINFIKDNNGKMFYILNPDYLIRLKNNYLQYDTFKEYISNYKSTEAELRKDKTFKKEIKSLITSKIKSKFPKELKDVKFICSFPAKYKNKKLKCDYYLKSCIIPQKSFRYIYNLLNKYNIQFLCNRVALLNSGNVIVEINSNIIEFFSVEENLIIIPQYMIVFNNKDIFFDKLQYYQSLENFLIKENIEKPEDKHKNFINLSKESEKKYGKIFNLGKLFKYNSNNINKKLESCEVIQRKTIEKLNIQINSLTQKNKKFETENIKLKNQLKENNNSLIKKDNYIKNILEKNNELQKNMKERNDLIKNISNEKNVYINKINNLKNKLKEYEIKIENNEKQIKDIKDQTTKEIKRHIQDNEKQNEKYKSSQQENQALIEKNIQLENINKKLQKNIEELNNIIKNRQTNNHQNTLNQNQNNINLNQNNMNPMMNVNQNAIIPNHNLINNNQNLIPNQNFNLNLMNQNPIFNFINPNQNFMNAAPNNFNQMNLNNQIIQNQIISKPPSPVPKKPIFSLSKIYNTTPQKGLVNIGSTCYMNATLQCFSQTKPMTEYFLNQEHKDLIINGLNNSNQSGLRLAKEYYNVVYNLWNIDGQKFYEPRMFKHVLGSLNNLFKKMEASDAKDMIVFFLEQIHKEINRVKPPEINTTNFAINQYNREEMLNHFFNEFKINNKSIISDNFFIITETTQKCQNCKNHNTPNYICYNYNIQNCFIFPLEEVRKYRDSRLMNQQMNQMNQMMMGMMGMNMNMNINMNYPQINTSGKVVSLEDCFEFNQKEELMFGENRIYCNLCRQNAESLYGNKILVLPNILIMILNRGKDNIYDIDLPFKEEINLTNYVLNAKEQYIYNIYGVITHLGPSGESGHFIASCKSPIDNDNNKWYKYNDAMVSKINDFNKEVVQMKTPYILFYQRKKQ